MPPLSFLLLILVGVAGSLSSSHEARAQVPLLPDEVERVDVIAIERDARDLFAFDALSGRRSAIRLEIEEEILYEGARGRIGIVVTNRRVLGVSPGTSWQEHRFRIHETRPETALVEDRIGLVVTDRRALAYTGAGGWIDEGFSPSEIPVALRAGSAAGVVTTNRRALGVAPGLARFVGEDLRVRELLESVTAQDTIITLRTDRRILVFRAPRASWTTQKRQLR